MSLSSRLISMEKKKSVREKVSNKYIPDDIAFSILSKLPLKSLKRFECVRKSWSLLSENTQFMNMFRNDFLNNSHRSSFYYDQTSLFLRDYEPNDQSVFYSLSGNKFQNKLKLGFSRLIINHKMYYPLLCNSLGSIHGPLCVFEFVPLRYYNLALWKPTNNEFKVIPPSPVLELSFPNASKLGSTLQIHVHGFGYDRARNDYKVIRYVRAFGDTSFDPLWEIYSLRSNLWRKLDVDMPTSPGCGGVQVYADGVCHWLCKGNKCAPFLVSFDLSNEMFSTTPVPFAVNDALRMRLAVLNGSIAWIAFHREMNTYRILILGQVGVKESWTELFIVGPLPCFGRLIGMGTKGEMFFTREDRELAWFDLSTQMIHELGYKVAFPMMAIYKENNLPIEGIRS